jgi:hypothetical protein
VLSGRKRRADRAAEKIRELIENGTVRWDEIHQSVE